MVWGRSLPWSQVIYQYVRDWGDGKHESTVVYYADKTKVLNAAFANSSFGHVMVYSFR